MRKKQGNTDTQNRNARGWRTLSRALRLLYSRTLSLPRGLRALVRRSYTIMVVPHNTASPLNFTINFAGIVFIALITVVVAVSSVWMVGESLERLDTLSAQESQLHQVQASVDSLRDELQGLLRSARTFDAVLSSAFAGVPGSGISADDTDVVLLSSVEPDGTLESDIDILSRLSSVLSSAGEPIAQAALAVSNKREFLQDIPTHWPVAGGMGIVTHEWGPNIHPFFGRWYWHTGFDVADPRPGLALVATANGTVVETGWQEFGFGNFVVIEHRFGIRTAYAHMARIDVSVGDTVLQGDRIGVLGSTGMSTGPHVHLEVIVGDQNVDPASFLTITNQFGRRTTRARL